MQCFTVIQPLNPFQKQEKTLPLLSLKGVFVPLFQGIQIHGSSLVSRLEVLGKCFVHSLLFLLR